MVVQLDSQLYPLGAVFHFNRSYFNCENFNRLKLGIPIRYITEALIAASFRVLFPPFCYVSFADNFLWQVSADLQLGHFHQRFHAQVSFLPHPLK